MGGVESICVSCLHRGMGNNSGYEYQIFRKMPYFGSISNYLRFFNQARGMTQGSGGMLSNITNLIPGFAQNGFDPSSLIPGYKPQGQIFPSGPGGSQNPMDAQSIFKMLNIMNLTPTSTKKISDSIFDVVDKNTFVRKVKKSNYNQLVKIHEGNNQMFTDPQFPPNNQSLGDLRAHGTDSSRISWKRVRDIMPNAEFIKDVIEPADILQGQLGDCYFLSALSALAEQGFRIKSLFPSIEINKYGIYMARVLHNGQYQQVVVDDYFPVDQNGRVFFAQPAGNVEIWVMVLEKIWAKLYGSYANIIGGLPNEVLHAFSSAPVYFQSIPSDSAKQQLLWQKMIINDKNGALLACGTKSDASIQEYGFVKGHAYTILGVYDRPQRMIKLRNPWGHKEWKGRASDYDHAFWNSVNATDKQLLDYDDHMRQKGSDGIFFVVWEDFLNFFQLVDICKISDNAHYNFIPTEFNNLEQKLFELEVRNDEPSLLTIAITQPSKRGTSLSSYSRNYAALGKWDQQYKCYRYVQTKTSKNFPDNFLEVERATSGKYCLYTKYLLNRQISVTKGTVSTYSLSPVAIKEARGITTQKFLKDIMYDHAVKNQKKKPLQNPNDWICSDILLNQGGFSYFVANIDNNSKSRLGVTVNESEYTDRRLVLQPPYRGNSVVKQEVKGGKPMVIVAELLSENFPTSITNPSPSITPLQ